LFGRRKKNANPDQTMIRVRARTEKKETDKFLKDKVDPEVKRLGFIIEKIGIFRVVRTNNNLNICVYRTRKESDQIRIYPLDAGIPAYTMIKGTLKEKLGSENVKEHLTFDPLKLPMSSLGYRAIEISVKPYEHDKEVPEIKCIFEKNNVKSEIYYDLSIGALTCEDSTLAEALKNQGVPIRFLG
jgi:hypothetical protein